MASNKSKSPASSKSPTQTQNELDSKCSVSGDGGVKLLNNAKKIDEKNPSGVNGANGVAPVQDVANSGMAVLGAPSTNGTVKQAYTIMAAVNGNSTNGKVAQANHGAKLSVNATAFKPKPAPIDYLNRDSTADDSKSEDSGPTVPVIVSSTVTSKTNHKNGKQKATQEPIGTRGENFSPTRKVFFTTDSGPDVVSPGAHYIKIMNVHRKELDPLLKALWEDHDWDRKTLGSQAPPKPESNFVDVFVAFDDVRATEASFEEIHLVNTRVNTSYSNFNEYADAKSKGRGTKERISFHDGQVVFKAQFGGLSSEMRAETAQHLYNEVHELAKRNGKVLAFAENDSVGGTWQFRAEYSVITVARDVLKTITKTDPTHIGKWTIYAEEYAGCAAHVSPIETIYKLENDMQCMSTPHKSALIPGMINTSPTGRTAWRYNENGEQVPVTAPKQLPKQVTNTAPWSMSQHPRNMSDPGPHTPSNGYMAVNDRIYPNSWSAASGQTGPYEELGYGNATPAEVFGTPTSVDVEKIMSGQDVRTTVMLRNLPNNMTFHQLKHLLDAVCFGKYDFSYLRVDFGNNMNVGYGFVNFTDPMSIVDFVRRYVGRPWIQARYNNRKRGPRIADVSYATVQGYDCLVEKFRNSSVMDEYPDYRPKLWWTYESASNEGLVGTEINFPKPNNPSKHQRSRDNATQVGLYTSGNRRNRNHQANRNRRSQYDRGTSAQMREDANYNQQFVNMSPLQNGFGFVGPNYMFNGPPMPVGPPPRFPIMPAPGMNGFVAPNEAGAMTPYGYGSIHFIDPFVNNGYPVEHHAHGIAPMNVRLFSHPETPTSGRRFYQSGVDCDRIPKSIAEEEVFVDHNGSYPTGQNGNGYDRAFGSHH